MSALAARTGAINLGQGFPDADGPPEVLEAAVAAMRAGDNQYPPGNGIPALRQAIADHQRRYYGIELDPDTEVLVTVGATEAIAAALLGLCEPGDEVVVLEPYYDSYAAASRWPARRATGDAAPAGLPPRPRRAARRGHAAHPADPAQHAAQPDRHGAHPRRARGDRRRRREHDLVVITDEVYEHLVYDGEHVPLATLPGMARAHADDLQRRQDVQRSPAGRSAGRAGRASS